MKRDCDLMLDILDEFERFTEYVTDNQVKIEHVKLLEDRGLVEADYCPDERKPSEARIRRITDAGHDVLVRIHRRATPAPQVKNLHVKEDLIKTTEREGYESQRAFAKTMYLLSSGALTLSFLMVDKHLELITKSGLPILWIVSVLAWIVSLICQLFSSWTSSKAFEAYKIGLQSDDFSSWNNVWTKWTRVLNVMASVLFVIGVGIFSYNLYYMMTHLGK